MSSFVKQIFLLVGILFLSLVLFSVILGPVSRSFVWNSVEKAYQLNWDRRTQHDGDRVSQVLTDSFNSLQEVTD